jgi:hypothetical protein
MKLDQDQRSALRKEIVNHAGWPSYRLARANKSISEYSKDEILSAATALGIDIEAVINRGANAATSNATSAESENTMKERNVTPEQVASLEARYLNVMGRMTSKDRDFCYDVFRTISGKQNHYATERQASTLSNIIVRAEMFDGTSNATESATETKPVVADASFDKNDAGLPIWNLVKGHALTEVFDHIKPAIEKALSNVHTVKIEMTSNGATVGETTGHQHPMFQTLCRILSSRAADGFVPNVWISGPAGSGKTHSVRSFAKAAGLDFYYNGALRDAFELLGYRDANGVYHTTAFREAYEKGGVYLFDEVDGSDNAALLALNGALANGIASFPDGTIERHPDCRIVATGNTWGLGATSDYVGRSKIDAAFLDRFGARIGWDYDVALEIAISGNEDFTRRVQAARVRARAAGLKVLITPRASIAGAALIAAGLTHDEAASLTYLANLSDDQKKIVEGRA